MNNVAIFVKDLRKSYGATEAVRGIDLVVERGEVFALLGPNGAGKTTTVEILEGHRAPTSGTIEVLGFNPSRNQHNFKSRIGIVLQTTGIEPYLTVRETINLFRGYYRNPLPLNDILEATGLEHQQQIRVRKLSGGQQRRLDVAVGLAGNPELFFLDEPTTGFDPSARRHAWEMIRKLQNLGKTIFLTTHYMDEAESLSSRVALIVKGKIVATGSPSSLVNEYDVTNIRFKLDSNKFTLPENLTSQSTVEGDQCLVTTNTPRDTLLCLTTWAKEQDVDLLDITVSRPTLEEVYLRMVNENSEIESE